jgi:hypothetical protein
MESSVSFKIRGESEEVAITKVVSNYTFFLHKISRKFSPTLAIFPAVNSVFGDLISLWKRILEWPTCKLLFPPPGPACWGAEAAWPPPVTVTS